MPLQRSALWDLFPHVPLRLSFLLLAVSGMQSCKPTTQNQSDVQHQFGSTQVARKAFSPCKAPKIQPGYSESIRYLNDLKNAIARANPNTFQGELAAENICIEIDTADTGTGGGAFGDSGRIMVERLSVKKAESDAELGALLCHELAHVSMQHLKTQGSTSSGKALNFSHGIGPDRYFQQLQQYPNYRTEKQALDALNRRLVEVEKDYLFTSEQQPFLAKMALPKELYEAATKSQAGGKAAIEYLAKCTSEECRKFKASNDKMNALSREKNDLHHERIPLQEYRVYQVAGTILPPEILLTWVEREADEVGLELCVRAGFDTRKILSHRERRIRDTGSASGLENYKECRAGVAKALANVSSAADPYGRVPEIPISDAKFPGPHPEECWRLFNIERELLLHARDFQPFMKNLATIVPGGLERAKREIEGK